MIHQQELAFCQGLTQIPLQRHARLQSCVHLRLKEAIGSALIVFGPIQRGVGALEQLGRRSAVVRSHRNSDTRADRHAVAIQLEWLVQCLHNALRQLSGIFRPVQPHQQDGKLVTAKARDSVYLAHAGLEPLRDTLQKHIASGMAERIVDCLETIRIYAEHRAFPPSPEVGKSLFNPFIEENPVG